MMITMIVNKLTSFSKLTMAIHTFKLHTAKFNSIIFD